MTKYQVTMALTGCGNVCTQYYIDELNDLSKQIARANDLLSKLRQDPSEKSPAYMLTLEKLKRNMSASWWLMGMLTDTIIGARSEINEILEAMNRKSEAERKAIMIAIDKEIKKNENKEYRKTKSNKED